MSKAERCSCDEALELRKALEAILRLSQFGHTEPNDLRGRVHAIALTALGATATDVRVDGA